MPPDDMTGNVVDIVIADEIGMGSNGKPDQGKQGEKGDRQFVWPPAVSFL